MKSLDMAEPVDMLGMTLAEYSRALLESHGCTPGQARRAYREVFRDGQKIVRSGGREITLVEPGAVGCVQCEQTPEGLTTKFLIEVAGAQSAALLARGGLEQLSVESVVIPMIGRTGRRTNTLCVSSQVGCALGCEFCETAQMGLIRSLTPAEIVAQWFAATHDQATGGPRKIDNIVFMGMGEPMDNIDAVCQAIRVLCEHDGAGIGASNISVSTVGRIDGLKKLARFVREPGFHKLGLAVSINAPNDEVRSRIMPVNRSMPMNALRDALLEFPMRPGGRICFEYVLIPGVNDRPEHALELAEYLLPFGNNHGKRTPTGLVNLIPYNPRRDSPWRAPSEQEVEQFVSALIGAGVYVKRRRTKGRTMMGACGQLGTEQIRRRRVIAPTIGGNTVSAGRELSL